MHDQLILNNILKKNKAQPVGWGYSEIIVKKEYVELFLMEVFSEGFNVISIGWWEYCSTMDKKSKLGMGGPKSIYFDGWFSEIGFVDPADKYTNITGNEIDKVLKFIKNIDFKGITFENSEILAPSFELDVPDNWNNDVEYVKFY